MLLFRFFFNIKFFNLVFIMNVMIYLIKKILYLKFYKYFISIDEVIFDFEWVKIWISIFDDVCYKFVRYI